jgi:aminoglycoside phosphotransferase (APT) family kinase protein
MSGEPASRPTPEILDSLASWLTDALGEPVTPGALVLGTPTGGGWSNDTWLVSTGAPEHHDVVVRLQPTRASMFPTYDLSKQLLCLEALADEPDVPTPPVLASDLAGTRLGRSAFVMARIDGRVPADDSPTFAEAGWLVEAAPADQRRFLTGLVDCMAAVHAVDVDRRGLSALRPLGPGHSNDAAVRDLRSLWEWDQGPIVPQGIGAALDRLAATAPDPRTDVLLWGDARPANVVVAQDDFVPVALLDWELATVGPPELDVTWLLEMNWVRIEGAGLAALPGFPTDDEVVSRYEQHTGTGLTHLAWYRYLAATRVAVLMHRYLRAMVHAGRLPADHRLLADTVATRRLASLSPA